MREPEIVWRAGVRIRFQKVPFTVAGVLAPVGADDDDVAVVPLTTFLAKIHYGLGRTFDGAFLVSPPRPSRSGRSCAPATGSPRGDDDDFIVRDLR